MPALSGVPFFFMQTQIRLRGRPVTAGFTLIELLIVMAIVGILGAAAVAGYRQVRARAGEAAAASALQAINQAQFAFSQTCGNQRFAPNLASLGARAPITGAAFLSPDLATGDPAVMPGPPLEKSGYLITMTGTPVTEEITTCIGVKPVSDYAVTADPLRPGISGHAFFGTNTDRVIFTDSATFTENMPGTGAPGHGAELR
jgi:prepilin-type N-terminal cleavage/methylation domain-containing protein